MSKSGKKMHCYRWQDQIIVAPTREAARAFLVEEGLTPIRGIRRIPDSDRIPVVPDPDSGPVVLEAGELALSWGAYGICFAPENK